MATTTLEKGISFGQDIFEWRFPKYSLEDECDLRPSRWRLDYENWWIERFGNNGVPTEWTNPKNSPRKIVTDFKNLSSPEEIEALVTESNYTYCLSVIQNVKLSPSQLGLALAHPEFSVRLILDDLDPTLASPNTSLQSLIGRQIELGMKDEEAEVAIKIARNIIRVREDLEPIEHGTVDKYSGSDVKKRRKIVVLSEAFGSFEVPYSRQDLEKGIKVPSVIDKEAAATLGLAYGCGHFNGRYFRLHSPVANAEFFNDVVGQSFNKTFNLPLRKSRFNLSDTQKGKGSLTIQYQSLALSSYLLNHHDFPKNRQEKRQTGLSPFIKKAPKEEQDEFLKYFLAVAVNFFGRVGKTEINSVSEPLLYDIQELINARISKQLANPDRRSVGSFVLRIGILPTAELFLLGYLNENPEIKERVEAFFTQKVESNTKTKRHLERVHPDKMAELQVEPSPVTIYTR